MDNRKRRSVSENDQEDNGIEKRLRRLEDAILKRRERKRHKKRRRRRQSSRSSYSSQATNRSGKFSSDDSSSKYRRVRGSSRDSDLALLDRNLSAVGHENLQPTPQAGKSQNPLIEGKDCQNAATQACLPRPSSTVISVEKSATSGLAVGQALGVSAQQSLERSQVGDQALPSVSTDEHARSEAPLDPAILEIMGKRFLEERVLAAPIPQEMVVRWNEILRKGLPTEERVTLIKKYPPPSNSLIIDPPRINPEIRASLQDAVVKRDERIVAKQTKIAACLAAIGKSFSEVLDGGGEKLVILEQLSDAGRVLSDLQHDEAIIRKSLILANLNASFKDVLNAAVPDEFLFGKSLDEKLKLAKALESSRKELKGPTKFQAPRSSKNSKLPPRQYQGNQKSAGTSGGKKDSKNQGYRPYHRDYRRNESSGKSNQKYERGGNRKRY